MAKTAKTTTTRAPRKTKKKVAKKAPSRKAPAPPAPDMWGHQPNVMTRDQAIGALVHSMNSDEKRLIVRADEAPNTYMLRRPIGPMELDIDCGGGFPAGGCCMLSGPDNSGKTLLALKAMAMQQKLYGTATRVMYVLTEGMFPFDQALRVGLKVKVPDEMLSQWQQWRQLRGMPLYTPEELLSFKEEVGQVFIARGYTGEEVLHVILQSVLTNAFSLIICDSVNGLLPSVDAAKKMDKRDAMAAHANMMTKFWKKYIPLTTGIDGANTTSLVFTQQARANTERANAPSYMQAAIKMWQIAGAYASKHYKLIDLVVWDGKILKREKNGVKEVVGKMTKWELQKGKAGTHDNKSGEMAMYYAHGGPDDIGELIAAGTRRGVIQPMSKGVVVVRPDTGEVLPDFSAPSQKAFRKMLESDFEFELAVRREILTQAGLQCLYR
jgi:RecA/RadA recombinase